MSMDVDSSYQSNVDDWLPRFSPAASSFPFPTNKIQSIEFRRARMADLLIFDVLLMRGGIRNPDMFFPPADWVALGNLLRAIDDSAYDILKKDCLVFILLKWAWDLDSNETNPGWDARFVQDRCIAPQFVALADAYWLLDTGTHLAKAVSILSDSRLNRDYVSKILQALALSSSPASFANSTSRATAALVVKYVRTAKPLLTEPDDIDLYALSLAQLSFIDAWAYQKSFPEGSDTRERLFGKIVGWCLTPSPKQEPLAQLLAIPLSSYEASFLHTLALPSQFSSSSSLSSLGAHTTTIPSNLVLPSQAISILQDLLVVRAIQSGDYVRAIKLDRQFSSVSPSLGTGVSSSNIASQATLSSRDAINRKSIIQDLFAALPPAERTLLEDEIGKVATGVRASVSTPKQANPTARKPLMAESSLSASWEDVGAGTASPAPSHPVPTSSSAAGVGIPSKTVPAPASTINKMMTQSPFSTPASTPRPQPVSIRQAPPLPKFTAFGSPIPSTTGVSTGRGVITERVRTLFSTETASGPNAATKLTAHVSLFDTTGSAKNAPNAFYKPPSAPAVKASLDVASVLTSSNTAKAVVQVADMGKQNGKAQRGESDGEDVKMVSGSDIDVIEEDRHHESGGDEEDEEAVTDEEEEDARYYITQDKSEAADLTLPVHHASEAVDDDGPDLWFSVFSNNRSPVQNGRTGGHGKKSVSGVGDTSYASLLSRARVSPPHEADRSLSTSVNSASRSRQRVPPGAFHHEEDDEDEDEDQDDENEDEDEEEGDRASLTTPVNTPHRSTRTRKQTPTPSRPSLRSQSQRSLKSTTTTGDVSRPSVGTGRPSSANQTIPGSLMDEEDDTHHSDAHSDGDTEMDEQGEEEDAVAPLPARSTRRTRSSGFVGAPTTTSGQSKPAAKTATGTGTGTSGASKGKAKARPSEPKTPARRSSRLSMASSTSPDHAETASPTKLGRKSTGSRASVTGSASGAVTTRSSTRRKR